MRRYAILLLSTQVDFCIEKEILITRGVENPGGIEGIFVLGGLGCRKFRPREPHFQSMVTNPHTGCSTLGAVEGPLGDYFTLMSLAQVDFCIRYH